ncbi:MAG: cytochrome B6 [Sulfuricurvum sp. MLSB]|uniref:cytochrome-c peroxidase n=1 Tax=unclassified Sulfuricurvum TaxID=2632390 RepID=UPI00050319A0|nr:MULTISPECIES: cytochrome c peroxidase [unclassified Sulfuricurvum]KFN39015.1 MAG: cytochrome B6 [Sulfuricurvum sp. MLSB]
MKRIGQLGLIVLGSLLMAAEPIVPIPRSVPHDASKASLGEKLFFDPILSKDHSVACVSCHDIFSSGADGKKFSTGIRNLKGRMNAPTVFNSVFNFAQFWNGRAKTLNEQALGPIHNPVEMALPLPEAARRLQAHPYYSKAFAALTGHPAVSPKDIADMIAEYEKTLITPNGKFDRYLRNEAPLSALETQGYLLFKTLGCVACHNGVNVGGNSFQKMGAIVSIPYNPKTDDRYALTKRPIDKNVFKVPTLRNIAQTAPYFHDGSAATLSEAIARMSYHNLGLTLSPKEIRQLVAFLNTLSGELPQPKGAHR